LQTSIDINFSERILPNREEAKLLLRGYLSTNPFEKLSEDDCCRLIAASKKKITFLTTSMNWVAGYAFWTGSYMFVW
jgi:hypothetical protein